MQTKQNERRFSRSEVHFEVAIETDQQRFEGQSANISMGGLFVQGGLPLTIGDRCTVLIKLGDGAIVLSMAAEVVRVDDNGCGMRFVNIALDSLEHLRRLVILNSSNPELAESEIRA